MFHGLVLKIWGNFEFFYELKDFFNISIFLFFLVDQGYSKIYYSSMFKKHIDLCFSHSLHQLIIEPTITTGHAKTLTDHVLTNSPEKVIQSVVIEMRLSDHELIYCSKKVSLIKLNERCEISFRSMKNYSDKIIMYKSRSIKFPDYSNHTYVNDAFEDIVTKFLYAIDPVSPFRNL